MLAHSLIMQQCKIESSGACTSLTAGTPTLYGSVIDADNKIASAFEDYLNMDRGSNFTSKYLFDNVFNVVGVVNDDIKYCTNAEVLGSRVGRLRW